MPINKQYIGTRYYTRSGKYVIFHSSMSDSTTGYGWRFDVAGYVHGDNSISGFYDSVADAIQAAEDWEGHLNHYQSVLWW